MFFYYQNRKDPKGDLSTKFQTESDNIRMKDCVIAYIDILGTKSILESDDEEKVITFIQNLSELYHSMSDYYIEKRIFSDNIMIFDDYSEEKLQSVIDIACQTQYYLLMKYKLLSRGGIVRGKLYYDENFVIGKGLVDAYRIESEDAITPRIVLSDDLSLDLPLTCRSVSDNHIMVDYMGLLFDQINDMPNYNQVETHRRILIELANADRGKIDKEERKKIDYKYRRIIQYHNRYCEKYDLVDLLIEPKEVKVSGL